MSGLNETPRSERLHIAFFGRTNAGKSTLINALANQNLSLVSSVAGTTADPVYKAMELSPLGPVVIIDTAGLDDNGDIGYLRSQKTKEVMDKTDLAVLVIAGDNRDLSEEKLYIKELEKKNIPIIIACNDFGQGILWDIEQFKLPFVKVNAQTRDSLEELLALIASHGAKQVKEISLTEDLIFPGQMALLVMPQDIQAPKGRLILPQVQMIRDLLDKDCLIMTVKMGQLQDALQSLRDYPALIITDSQVFDQVYAIVGDRIPLTSFSVLLSRAKGDIRAFVQGAQAIELLQPGDKVLIAEACTHHALEGDIARKKLPALLEKYVGGPVQFDVCSGHGFPEDLSSYKLIIHCGACMINRKNMLSRIEKAHDAGLPITNFGIAIAYLKGILDKIKY